VTLSPSGGSVEYIGSSANNQASGTGLFDPFVRLQGSPTEKGYNTGGAVAFDTKSGTWTKAIKVNAIPIVDCDGTGPGTATCWELFNDINESNTAKRISLNVVEVWFTTNANLVGYVDPTGFPAGTATKEYEFNGDILINDVNQGSGRGDLRYLIPTAGHTWTADTYFVLYSEWGTTSSSTNSNFGTGGWGSEGGFEEWKVRKTPNLSIVKTADATSVNAGSPIGFTITVTNNGVADATGVTISDPLPAGSGVDWAENPDNPNCSIAGTPPTEVLNCGPVTLAPGASLSVHVQSSTTAASCGIYNNTATFTSTNAGTGSASASLTVNCAAIRILKNSSKGGAANAGAVFSITGAGITGSLSVTDDLTAAAPDEDADAGEVCVSGLVPGATYTVTETSPPTGYAGESGSKTVVAVSGNCASGSLNSVTFTNPPLFDIQVNFRDGGSGDTAIGPSPSVIDCNTTTGTESTTDATGWTDTLTVTGARLTSATMTITCTIPVDP
jgi:uncharacterized repeat protein (TIGR01451 family)